ncbi:MAG TPA: LytR C-terminal domain-containing protein [Acidimicrobiales bacterium]|jgi:hypothetical protein|nr:LytR C-terminal domain-containing protein [Acidimicrobiales bacterium]
MNAPRGGHTSGDGSFAKDAGTQTTKAVVLVAVAVIVGIVLLNKTPSPTPATTTSAHHTSKTSLPSASTVPSTTPTTAPPPAPSTVKVIVFNGTTAPVAAGYFSAKLKALGYDTLSPENATATTVTSSVVYANAVGFQSSAAAIARSIGLSAAAVQTSLPSTAPLSSSVIQTTSPDVVVLIGSDISGQSLSTTSTTASSSAGVGG